ncbi:MAG: ABC transporter ATP-binding protein [Phycisphaerae bacterium]|nr:ABC transporter ATP-binding protein [Phycisphaerae bacterium]MDD5380865.1 ABC transporter ATP-binding protein [Phycisphaerae bacterium]
MEVKKDEQNNRTAEGNGNGIIVIKNLTKQFGNNIVLDNITLSIEKGKTTVVIGPSGCGKTVLIKNFIVLLRPSSGEVYFKDKRIDNLPDRELNEVRTHYGFLFQGGALFDSLSVAENIMFPIWQHHDHAKIDWKQAEDVVKTKLAMVGLDGFQQFYPANLSGGQKKRVALARAIALNPEVILYDEPTTGLDPIRADVINELILKLQRELGETAVVVTHDMTSAYKVADRIIMLHNGKIIADGDADHIHNHPHPAVQQFISGQVGQDDLAVLRASGIISKAQFLPRDFEEDKSDAREN